jgi:hypothetical protein
MRFANTLKYNITVKRSFYAAAFVFALYCSFIILLLLIFNISWLTFLLYLLLLVIAVYGARKAYQFKCHLKISESGQVNVIVKGETINGVVSTSSFYNALFISLCLKSDPSDFTNISHSKKRAIIIYRDAVSELDYRLVARIINFSRD